MILLTLTICVPDLLTTSTSSTTTVQILRAGEYVYYSNIRFLVGVWGLAVGVQFKGCCRCNDTAVLSKQRCSVIGNNILAEFWHVFREARPVFSGF
eukprot:5264263-Amphidinium_carterae.1